MSLWRCVSSSSGRRGGPSSSARRGVKSGPRTGAPSSQVMSTPSREVAEVAQVETEGAVRPAPGPSCAICAGERRLAVGGEAHHLVLVAEAGEAEKLGDRGVELPSECGKQTRSSTSMRAAAAHREHGRDEVAEAVDREAHRLLERRAEEGRGEWARWCSTAWMRGAWPVSAEGGRDRAPPARRPARGCAPARRRGGGCADG